MTTTFAASSKLARIVVSPILALSRRASLMKAEGLDVIDMTVGEPDFDTPEHVRNAASAAMDTGQTRYTALPGSPALVAAIAAKAASDHNMVVAESQVIACAGAKQVISNALAASLNDGDEVILPTPCWASYGDMVRLQGGVEVAIDGRWDPAGGWRLDPAAIEAAITSRTRWLFLNSPSNPTGAVNSREELEQIAAALRRHPGVWVISDDIYEHIAFDDERPPHILDVAPDLEDRTLSVNGVSKAYAMTGWRLGWGVGPSELIKAMVVVQSQLTSAPSSISQAAAIAAIEGPQECVAVMLRAFARRRDALHGVLAEIPGVCAPPPKGAFYYFPSIESLLGARTAEGNTLATDVHLAEHLLTSAGVAAVPGSAFGAPGWLRFSFALSDAALQEAGRRLSATLGDLKI